ncbi:MAG TPA: hypothetical protein VF885_24145 [Arthrobacter sp.]
MKSIFAAIGTILGAGIVVGVFALLLMLLMNAAFPALDFGFWNATALLGIAVIFGIPAMMN